MNIAICDDDLQHVNSLKESLSEMSGKKIKFEVYENGEDLSAEYKCGEKKHDVIFLDMEMREMSGIETAIKIRENDEYVIIIFVTSHTEYMQESFKCSPFRFLVKPLDTAELKAVFDDVCEKLSKKKIYISFSENKSIFRICCEDIIYCESQNHFVFLHTKDKTYKICKSLTDLHKQLDNELLYRVHSSFIVNFHYVKSIKNNTIELYHCDKNIPISRTYKKNVFSDYTQFVERDFNV